MQREDLAGPAVIHSQGTIRYASPEFCALNGLETGEQIAETSLEPFFANGQWEAFERQCQAIDSAQPVLGLKVALGSDAEPIKERIAISSQVDWEGDNEIHTAFLPISQSGDEIVSARRESAMEAAPIGITIADPAQPDMPLTYVNDAFVKQTGYPREEVLGRNCRFLQGEKTREEPIAKLRDAIEAEEPVCVELRNYRKDGTMYWNRVTISPVTDDQGEVTHFLGYQEDITAEKIIENEKGLFESHADATEQALCITDTAGTIQYVNPAFESMTGYGAHEAIGETPYSLNTTDQDEAFFSELAETMAPEDVWESEITCQTRDGEIHQVEQTVIPVTDDRGEISHFTILEHDITDKRLTDEVMNVLDRVLRHNLRTEINVIDGYAALLEEDMEPAKHETATRMIRERSAKLRELSEQITTIRKLVQGHNGSSKVTIDHIEAIVDRTRKQYEEASMSLDIDAAGSRSIKNGSVFQIALETAIENAVTQTTDSAPAVEITVRAGPNDRMVTIDIADNGPEIPEEEWENITSGTETPLEHTSGLGLWILYWAVIALGGRVEKSANEPAGNVICMEIPLVAAEDTRE